MADHPGPAEPAAPGPAQQQHHRTNQQQQRPGSRVFLEEELEHCSSALDSLDGLMGQQGQQPPWELITELQNDYALRRVPMDANKIDDDIRVLLVKLADQV